MSSESLLIRCLVAAALAAGLTLGACADFSRGEPSPKVDKQDAGGGADDGGSDGGGSDGVALSFAKDVEPLLVPTCQMCHAPGQMAGDTQLLFTGTADTDYMAVMMFVDTSAPAGSRLLSKMAGNGHQGGTVYAAGSPEYQTVLHWIEQGAPQ